MATSLPAVRAPLTIETSQSRRILSFDGDDTKSKVSVKVKSSPCSSDPTQQISNDHNTEEEHTDSDIIQDDTTDSDCPLATFYGRCVAEEESYQEEVKEMELSFDYELWTIGDSATKVHQTLEASMAEYIAQATGLDVCDETINRKSRLLKKGTELTESELEYLQGLSSDPVDLVDSEITECSVSVKSELADRAQCIPMKGFFTVYLRTEPPLSAAEQTAMQTKLLKLLESGMKNDKFVGTDIEKVVYVGERPIDDDDSAASIDSPPPSNNNPPAPALTNDALGDNTKNSSRLSPIDTGFISGLSVLVLVGLAFWVSRGRKGSSKKNASFSSHDESSQLDLEDLAPGSLAEKDELALQPSSLKSTRLEEIVMDSSNILDTIQEENEPTSFKIRPHETFPVTAGDSKTVLSMNGFETKSSVNLAL
jgi:hypothetical protein